MEHEMNKKGSVALRDIIFMIIIVSGIFVLASIFVLDMGTTYENTDMNTEYSSEGIGELGEDLYYNVNESVGEMYGHTDEATGTFGAITGAIEGAGAILKVVILSPLYIKTAIETGLEAMNVPSSVSRIVVNTFLLIITAIIIFVIISALSRGGTKL